VGLPGTILHTTNGGTTWKAQKSGHHGPPRRCGLHRCTHGWVSGFGIILATKNGGATWKTQYSSNVAPFTGVAFANAKHGWVVAEAAHLCHH